MVLASPQEATNEAIANLDHATSARDEAEQTATTKFSHLGDDQIAPQEQDEEAYNAEEDMTMVDAATLGSEADSLVEDQEASGEVSEDGTDDTAEELEDAEGSEEKQDEEPEEEPGMAQETEDSEEDEGDSSFLQEEPTEDGPHEMLEEPDDDEEYVRVKKSTLHSLLDLYRKNVDGGEDDDDDQDGLTPENQEGEATVMESEEGAPDEGAPGALTEVKSSAKKHHPTHHNVSSA